MKPRHPRLIEAIRLSATGRNPEAVQIIQQLAASGEPDALFLLAEMNWRGGLVPVNPWNARILYYAAGDKGSTEGGVIYTNLLASGIAGPRDWPQALARLEIEAKQDPRRAIALAVVRAMALTEDGDPLSLPQPEQLSKTPDLQRFRGLFTAAECEYLTVVADTLYRPSMVQREGRQVPDPLGPFDSATLHWQIEDPAVHALNRRLGVAAALDAANGEAMQILHFRPGQEFKLHLDFNNWPDNERVRTAHVWLNDGYEGGETRFGDADLTLRGGLGDAVVFSNVLPDGKADPLSAYAGLPVIAGEKYLASRWIHALRWQP